MKDWVKRAIEFKGSGERGGQAEVARLLASECGWSTAKGTLNKILTASRPLRAEEMYDIAKVTGYPVPSASIGDKALEAFLGAYYAASEFERTMALAAATAVFSTYISRS